MGSLPQCSQAAASPEAEGALTPWGGKLFALVVEANDVTVCLGQVKDN